MSTRTTLRPQAVIVNGNMSGNIVSAVTILQSITRVSYAYTWVGVGCIGTFTVEVSNDYALGADGRTVINPGTWIQIPLIVGGSSVTSIAISGAPGNGQVAVVDPAAYAIRTVYTFAAGTGTLQATINGQVA